MTLLADFPADVRRALPRLVGFRFISNIGVRYPYSFLRAPARGAGFSVEEMSTVLSAREFTGALAPAAGRIADRGGSGKLMSAATFLGVAALEAATIGRWGSRLWLRPLRLVEDRIRRGDELLDRGPCPL